MAGENAQAKDPKVVVIDDPEVVIVDDTPPEDRNRAPLPEKMVKELEEDDLAEYSEKVQQRMSQLKKVFHDERRLKEAAGRERDEALSFARMKLEENELLRKRLGAGEKIFVEEGTRSAKSEIESARERLKQAVESGDADKIASAQESMTDAKLKLNEYARFQPTLQPDTNGVQAPQQTRAFAPPQPSRKAMAWRDKNSWFGADKEMTALALGVHEKLVESGADTDSDGYYEQLDKTMRKRFPDYFGESTTPEPKSERRNSTVVATASRSSAPRQIRLTASAAALAKRLGITPEAYAREQLKLENPNG